MVGILLHKNCCLCPDNKVFIQGLNEMYGYFEINPKRKGLVSLNMKKLFLKERFCEEKAAMDQNKNVLCFLTPYQHIKIKFIAFSFCVVQKCTRLNSYLLSLKYQTTSSCAVIAQLKATNMICSNFNEEIEEMTKAVEKS